MISSEYFQENGKDSINSKCNSGTKTIAHSTPYTLYDENHV